MATLSLRAAVRAYLDALHLLDPIAAGDRAAIPHGFTAYRFGTHFAVVNHRLGLVWRGGRGTVGGALRAGPCEHSLIMVVTVAVVDRDVVRRGIPGDTVVPRSIRASIDHNARLGVRTVFVPVIWDWHYYGGPDDPRESMVHITTLVVDTRERTYALFDVNGDAPWPFSVGTNGYESAALVDLLAGRYRRERERGERPFLRGYRFRTRRSSRVLNPRSLGGRIHRTDADAARVDAAANVTSAGMCTSITTLVVLCCRVLNHPNPWIVAHALETVIARALAGPGKRRAREDFRMRLEHLYRRIAQCPNLPRLARLLALTGVTGGGGRAAGSSCVATLVDRGTGARNRCCGRPVCRGSGSYCGTHHHGLLLARWRRPLPPPAADGPCDAQPVPYDSMVPPAEYHPMRKRARDDEGSVVSD